MNIIKKYLSNIFKFNYKKIMPILIANHIVGCKFKVLLGDSMREI